MKKNSLYCDIREPVIKIPLIPNPKSWIGEAWNYIIKTSRQFTEELTDMKKPMENLSRALSPITVEECEQKLGDLTNYDFKTKFELYRGLCELKSFPNVPFTETPIDEFIRKCEDAGGIYTDR
jgi:hypothetical protein